VDFPLQMTLQFLRLKLGFEKKRKKIVIQSNCPTLNDQIGQVTIYSIELSNSERSDQAGCNIYIYNFISLFKNDVFI
jgi:hypothetical protein